MLDMRCNATAFTHLGFDTSARDAFNLQFPDDAGRYMEALVWEDEYSPVVRLELARRLVKGFISAHIPGSYAEPFFRHRNGGKTYLIFADPKDPEGRAELANWGDSIENGVKIGFRVSGLDGWSEMNKFTRQDPAESPMTSAQARSPFWWNTSPAVLNRQFTAENGAKVDFTGRYWLSDEDRPLEFSYQAATAADNMQVVVGAPGQPMVMLGNPALPTTLHLPDRKTTFRSDLNGDRTFEHPDFHYMLLSKPGDSGIEIGYGKALLIMWDGAPEKVEVVADKGYGQVRVSYAGPSGKVWLYPYNHIDYRDLEATFRSAEHFLSDGTLLQNGYPSQQFINAVPAGLAAGAYLLTRYNDPLAVTARTNAARMIDRIHSAQSGGEVLARTFFLVKEAAWMAKAAKEAGDQAGFKHFANLVDEAMATMCTPAGSYVPDQKGWPDGWTHFCSLKACWLAYEVTGNPKYLQIYEDGLKLYTIDSKGIYRAGAAIAAPGGFDTYCGALALGAWGHAGKLDLVDLLIHLDVPNGWKGVTENASTPVRDLWNDAGAGPYAQDDANPEFLGYSLLGAKVPHSKKYMVPVGAFPSYDKTGTVRVTSQPIVRNPFFLPGIDPVRVLDESDLKQTIKVDATVVIPGALDEQKVLAQTSGEVSEGKRHCVGTANPLVYHFDTKGANGLGLDLRMRGNGFRVEVSPDGKRWFERLDTWDDQFGEQSLDLSFLSGSTEELVRLESLSPPNESRLVAGSDSVVEREHCRYVKGGGAITYQLDLPQVGGCWLELMLGNGYQVEFSPDGQTWQKGIAATDADGGSGKGATDEAWIRMLDVSSCLKTGSRVFLRLTDAGNPAGYGGRTAFLRRLTAYGFLRTDDVWVKLSNVSDHADHSFDLERITLRKWKR